jgi:transcriptional regulator with GAF, ATPase, and Fis domain
MRDVQTLSRALHCSKLEYLGIAAATSIFSEELSGQRKLRDRLERKDLSLREEIRLEHDHTTIIGNSAAIRGVLRKAEQVAATDSNVLVLGETGTGKELIAQTIHELSGRSGHPMVKTNCAALPATLIESELFGREKGAYTGALAKEIGRFELADDSTIFLDEIGELPPEVQSKLLRVLQEGQFERLGSSKTIQVNVRVIAATSRNLQAMVKEGKFREDLFYRLNVFPILIPPLRERPEDIPALVWHIVKELAARMGRSVEGVHARTMREFLEYPWPGNVRELRNVIERGLILSTDAIFRAELPDLERDSNRGMRRLDEVEREYLRSTLQATRWRVRGKGGAAEVLGLKPTTLEARLKKLSICRPN